MEDLLVELINRRINLRTDGEQFGVEAPPGALTPELNDAITENRDRLVALLKGHPQGLGLPCIEPQTHLRQASFPLTEMQQAYLIGRNKALELGGVSPHFYLEFGGHGLEVPQLTAALQKVIDRQDMLRAVVDPDGGQRSLTHVSPYQIATTDLRDKTSAEQSAAIAQVRNELHDQVLPTDRWPLFDIRATILAEDDVRLHLSMDLLFVDVRSLFLMLNEWRRYYDHPTWSPAPLDLSFRDYVLAEQAAQTDSFGARAAEYWLARLEDLPAAPELPLAVAPEQLGRPSFIQRRAAITRERWAAIRSVASRKGLTPSVLLLVTYCEVLRAWSKRQDFTVTLTLLNRLPLHPGVDRIVGNFTSPSLLAVTSRPEETFEERAAFVQRQLLGDLAHSTFSGLRILRELAREEGDVRSGSMPVVFSNTLGADGLGADGKNSSSDALSAFGDLVHSTSQTPQVWLENQIFEDDGRVIVNWNAVDGLFPGGMLDAMFDAYGTLLDRLADDETVWGQAGGVVPLPRRQADERQRANATASDTPSVTLHGLVSAAATRSPDAVAVIADGLEFTYGQLTRDAYRLARRLRACCGAEPNEIIAVSMRPGADQIAALLGVLYSGAAYVSIDPDFPQERREKLVRRCQAKAVVTQARLRNELAWPPDIEVATVDEDATQEYSSDPVESRQDHDDLAYVMFTSGSTGEPKGVMISHRSVCNTIQDINARFNVDHTDRVFALAPTGFDLSVYDIFGILGAGGTVVVPSPQRTNDIAHWSELVDHHGITIWNSVPAPMRLWIDSLSGTEFPRRDRLRLALLSGDWIPTDFPDQIRKLFPEARVISLGGATEGAIWSVCYPIGDVSPRWPSIPYGKPLANQTLHVYNEWFEPCPTWVTGEIYIGGAGVAVGYWEDPVRTGERFVLHPDTGERLYKTGDLGRYLPGGDIEILGREDHQVKINGYRVELGEIEAALGRQAGVRQALVTAPFHPRTGQRQLVAHLVVEATDTVDGTAATEPARLREALAVSLPGFMVPNHYICLDRLPLTNNGKINHSVLPTPWNDSDETVHRVPPGNEVEERLLAIWSEQLGHGDLGTDDGFFDVGGDSLHAVGIISHLREEFGIDSAGEQEVLEGLFMNATIAEFAEILPSKESTP